MEFQKGMDLSFLPELEDTGTEIKDFDGTVTDALTLVQKYGVNSVRLRLWNQPENVKETKGYCDYTHTLAMAKRIKAHGMSFMLDFHYSDYWADPGQQRKPKAWEELDFDALQEAVYQYTKKVLSDLKAEGVLPDIVQIGNEIRSGLLFPDGELPNYRQMVQLVNAGIKGARAVAGADEMQVMIHLDQGGRYFYLKEWFDKSMEEGLADFDYIGLSYYPFWHGTFADLKNTMEQLVKDYHKPIMVVETAHAWRRSIQGFIDERQEKIAGIEATPAGQHKVLDMVANIVASIPDEMGQGIYYWEPICIPTKDGGGWSENMGLLDENGKIMEGIRAFEFTREDYRGKEPVKIYEPETIKTLVHELPKLPEKLAVLFYDGTIEKKPVVWSAPYEDGEKLKRSEGIPNEGIYLVEGSIEGVPFPAHCRIEAVKTLAAAENLLMDANWEEGMTKWDVEKGSEQVTVQLIPDFIEPFPAPPVNELKVEAPRNFTFSVSQKAALTGAGYYKLSVEFQGTDTTNVDIRLFLESEEGTSEMAIHPTEHEWSVYEVEKTFSKPQEVTVGIRISSPPIYGMMRRFCLSRQEQQQ